MSTESIRAEAYQSIESMVLPDILDPEDAPTLIADLEHVIGLLGNSRYMRNDTVVRRMMFEIAHLAMFGMQKFGIMFRQPEGVVDDPVGRCTFEHVKLAVDSERTYQDGLPETRCSGRGDGNTIDKNPLSVGASFIMLEHYIVNARHDWTMQAGDKYAMHCVRKIAAIAIRDLETHGLPNYTDHARGDEKTSE